MAKLSLSPETVTILNALFDTDLEAALDEGMEASSGTALNENIVSQADGWSSLEEDVKTETKGRIAGLYGPLVGQIISGLSSSTYVACTYANGWTASGDGAVYQGLKVRKDSTGCVRIRGVSIAPGGTPVPTQIATVPAGYRPARNSIQYAVSGGVFFEVHVQSGGAVHVYGIPDGYALAVSIEFTYDVNSH